MVDYLEVQRRLRYLGDEYEIRFGDKFATTDTDTPLPVTAFRSGHPNRPTILIAGAWYYPHELRRETQVSEQMEPNDKYQQDPYGEAEQAAARRVLEGHALADAQALADVRTLDEWAKANGMGWAVYFGPDTFTSGPGYCVRLGDLPPCATCPTPDAARHAAAEWVRDQSKDSTHAATIGGGK